ncbi:MAG: lipopolysaccharide biosynthesis protein [Pseudomonadota bacterium]
MRRRLLLNTASNYVVFALQIVVAFVMTPLYVRYMGLQDYGLWEVVVSIIGYAGMLDLGLWPTISRFVAKYQAENNRALQEATFATSLVFLSAIGVVGSLATLGLVVALEPDLFFGDGPDVAYKRWFLLILAINVVLRFPGILAEAYLEGQQRYFLKNSITVINLAFSTAVVYALIDDVWGLMLLAGVGAVSMVVKYSIFFFLIFRAQPQHFAFRPTAFSSAHLRVLLRFGAKSFIQGLSGRISSKSSPLIIAGLSGTALVPLFTIPASLVRYASTFLMTSTHASMPLFSQLAASGQEQRIKSLYLPANKAVVGVGSLMLLGVALIGPTFIAVWITPEVARESAPILGFLALGALGLGWNPFGSRYLTAIDRHGIYAKYGPVFAVVGVLTGAGLLLVYGLPGLAAGIAAPVAISLPVFVREVCRNLGVPMKRYFISFLPAVSAAAVAGYGALHLYEGQFGAASSYLGILGVTASVSVAYAVVFGIIDLLGPSEHSALRALVVSRRPEGGRV